MSILHRSPAAALVPFAFAFATVAAGADWRPATLADLPPPPHPPMLAAIAPPAAFSVQSGQLIFLDPATGTLSRTAPNAAALAAATAGMPRVVLDLRLQTTPAGHVFIDTNGLHETATAVLGADGSIHINCGHPAEHASHTALERNP